MPRILVSVVCAYWVTGFVLRGAEYASTDYTPIAFSLASATATACMLVAAQFLWVTIACLVGRDETVGDIAALSTVSAIIVLSLVLPAANGQVVGQLSAELSIHIVGLCVTWLLVARSDWQADIAISDESRKSPARRLARGAAHSTMLARFSSRGPATAGRDE